MSRSGRRPRALIRTLVNGVAAALVGAFVVGAIVGLGVLQTMTQSFATRSATGVQAVSAGARLEARDRITVAVALGVGGVVVADALAPYGVFAESERFDVFTVSSDGAPVGLSGGLTAVPDYSIADVRSGRAPQAEIVVVPAFADPVGPANEPVRRWIKDAHAEGATILGVCAGAHVLAEAGVLEGTRATSHFAELPGLRSGYPETTWVAGHRYVDDGRITTTAGVTSGIAASLHLVERFAGRAEAAHIGREVGASDWRGSHGTAIPINTTGPQDYPYMLGAALPWFKPTWGIALVPGSDEIDVAAAFEVYSGSSFAATLASLATTPAVQTEHGMTLLAATPGELGGRVDRLIVPGADTRRMGPLLHWAESKSVPVHLPRHADASESAFGAMVRDLGARTDRATAVTLAKYIEYPIDRVPADASVPSRLILLSAAVGLLGVAAAALTWQLVNPASRMRTALRRT